MSVRKSSTPDPKPAPEVVTDILKVSTGNVVCYILGTSPLILNRMSEKAKHELLSPRGRKTAVEKAMTSKHNPIEEYRASAHRIKNEDAPTLLAMPSTAFKGSIRTAALDMPGAKKAQIGRLTYIAGDYVGIYGLPKLFMSVVICAGMNRTPDVRTRAIVPTWACAIDVTFVQPLIRGQAVANLLSAAGITVGVGDWRPEKGAGSYGQFTLVDEDDPRWLAIVEHGGRAAQQEALDHPVCYDDETTELLSWFDKDQAQRKLKGVA